MNIKMNSLKVLLVCFIIVLFNSSVISVGDGSKKLTDIEKRISKNKNNNYLDSVKQIIQEVRTLNSKLYKKDKK